MKIETVKIEAAALLLTGIIEEVLVKGVAEEVMDRVRGRIESFCLYGSKDVPPPNPRSCEKAYESCERLKNHLLARQNTDETAISIFPLD